MDRTWWLIGKEGEGKPLSSAGVRWREPGGEWSCCWQRLEYEGGASVGRR